MAATKYDYMFRLKKPVTGTTKRELHVDRDGAVQVILLDTPATQLVPVQFEHNQKARVFVIDTDKDGKATPAGVALAFTVEGSVLKHTAGAPRMVSVTTIP